MSNVLNGNMYPVSSEHFEPIDNEPEDQKIEKEESLTNVLNALPLVLGLIKRFDERIAKFESIDSIGVSVNDSPEIHQLKVLVAKEIAETYRAEKAYFEEAIEELQRSQLLADGLASLPVSKELITQ